MSWSWTYINAFIYYVICYYLQFTHRPHWTQLASVNHRLLSPDYSFQVGSHYFSQRPAKRKVNVVKDSNVLYAN